MTPGEPVPGGSYGTFIHDGHIYEVTGDALASHGDSLLVWLNSAEAGPFVGSVPSTDTNFPSIRFRDLFVTRELAWQEAIREKAVARYFETVAERSLMGVGRDV